MSVAGRDRLVRGCCPSALIVRTIYQRESNVDQAKGTATLSAPPNVFWELEPKAWADTIKLSVTLKK